jgi:S1-C subfamily serine protease
VRQTVSAPVAVIVVALVAAIAVFVSSRQGPHPPPADEVFFLPPEPPVEEAELLALRRGTAPLGAFAVMPPLGPDRFRGTRVAMVAPGSPAAKGGIEPGDLILQFNDTVTAHPYALVAAIVAVNPDTVNEVVVERAGKEETLTVTGVDPSSLKDR